MIANKSEILFKGNDLIWIIQSYFICISYYIHIFRTDLSKDYASVNATNDPRKHFELWCPSLHWHAAFCYY